MLFLIAVVDMEAGIARTPPPGPPRPKTCPGLLSSSWEAPASPSSARVTRSPTIGRTGRSLLVSEPLFFLFFGPSINNVGSFEGGRGPRTRPGLLSLSWELYAFLSSARSTRSPTIGRTGRSLLVSGLLF